MYATWGMNMGPLIPVSDPGFMQKHYLSLKVPTTKSHTARLSPGAVIRKHVAGLYFKPDA